MADSILVFTADPSNTAHLSREVRLIRSVIERAEFRNRFQLETRSAVRQEDIRRAILDLKPTFVHFCGHGAAEEGLVFEKEDDGFQLVDGESLRKFFLMFSGHVRCVVLNACYSEIQANAISRHIPYVVGMNGVIEERAAHRYVGAFYDALGAGAEIGQAHRLGRNAIEWDGLDQHLLPKLLEGPTDSVASSNPLPQELGPQPSTVAEDSRTESIRCAGCKASILDCPTACPTCGRAVGLAEIPVLRHFVPREVRGHWDGVILHGIAIGSEDHPSAHFTCRLSQHGRSVVGKLIGTGRFAAEFHLSGQFIDSGTIFMSVGNDNRSREDYAIGILQLDGKGTRLEGKLVGNSAELGDLIFGTLSFDWKSP